MITVERPERRQDLGFIETLIALVPVLAPIVINLVKGFFAENPSVPTPDQIAAPINQGQYATKDAVAGYIGGQLAAFPPNVRPGVAQLIWAAIQNKTPEVGLGFRAAARQYEDLKPLVKQGAFGPETFMEKYKKVLIITGAVTGVAVLGIVAYRVTRR